MKKLILMMLMLFITFTSINAVEYLNECGKSSGWVAGETYILNFTEIPATYTNNNYCFYFAGSHDDINFKGIGKDIIVKKDLLNIFWVTNQGIFTNFDFNNISFIADDNIKINAFFKSPTYNDYIRFANYNNVKLIGFNYFFETSSQSGNSANYYHTFNNFYYDGLGEDIRFVDKGAYFKWDYWNFNNSIVISNDLRNGGDFIWNIENSYFKMNDGNYENTAGAVYTNSLLHGIIVSDTDNNNIADSNPQTNMNSNVITISLLGYNFIQDFTEGEQVYSYLTDDLPNIFINDETIPNNAIGGQYTPTNGGLNKFLGYLNIDEISQFYVNVGINCSILNNNKCNIQDDLSLTTKSSNEYKGLLLIGKAIINNINFTKVGSNNANIISNVADNYYSGTIISNNNFTKNDFNYIGTNNYFLKLKQNDLLISNNVFNSIGDGDYEILSIESTNPLSNIVTENEFYFSGTAGTGTEIFTTTEQDTRFYNNYLGNNIVLTNTIEEDLIINNTHTIEYNNKLYTFRLGNYYQDNTACTDINGDDICDSSYTSGIITDNYPLAVYPYNYLSNLANAESVDDIEDFNISLNVLDNETIEVTDDTTQLNLSFTQTGNYNGLSCDLYLDGVLLQNYQNVLADTNYNILINEFIEKSYSYRVECYVDEFVYKTSDEIIFNIIYSTGNNEPVNNTTQTNTTGTIIYEDINLIGDSVDETSDNVIGFFKDMTNGVSGIVLVIGLFAISVFIILGVIAFIS